MQSCMSEISIVFLHAEHFGSSTRPVFTGKRCAWLKMNASSLRGAVRDGSLEVENLCWYPPRYKRGSMEEKNPNAGSGSSPYHPDIYYLPTFTLHLPSKPTIHGSVNILYVDGMSNSPTANLLAVSNFQDVQPAPPPTGPRHVEPPPEIAGLMIRAYENPLVSLNKASYLNPYF